MNEVFVSCCFVTFMKQQQKALMVNKSLQSLFLSLRVKHFSSLDRVLAQVSDEQNSSSSSLENKRKTESNFGSETLNQKKKYSSDSRLSSCFFISSVFGSSFLSRITQTMFYYILFSLSLFFLVFGVKIILKPHASMFVDSFAAFLCCETIFFGFASVAFNYGCE